MIVLRFESEASESSLRIAVDVAFSTRPDAPFYRLSDEQAGKLLGGIPTPGAAARSNERTREVPNR